MCFLLIIEPYLDIILASQNLCKKAYLGIEIGWHHNTLHFKQIKVNTEMQRIHF